MTDGITTFIFPVTDLARAKTLYSELLSVAPVMDEPYYVGFNVAGPVGYWHVDYIRQRVTDLLAAGAAARDEVKDVGGGKLIATVTDPDGNVIGLIQLA